MGILRGDFPRKWGTCLLRWIERQEGRLKKDRGDSPNVWVTHARVAGRSGAEHVQGEVQNTCRGKKRNAPGAGPAGPQSGYDIRAPGGGGAGNLRPRITEIDITTTMFGVRTPPPHSP